MEFVIAGWLDYGDARDVVLGHFTTCAALSRKESGCLAYVVCADPDHAGRVVVFERWESEDDLRAHFQTRHIEQFREAVAPFPRIGRDLNRHFIERTEAFSTVSVASA